MLSILGFFGKKTVIFILYSFSWKGKAYLTFFFKFILFLFTFRQEFSCSCLTDRIAENPNRFSPIFCCNLPEHCLFSMSMSILRLPYFLMNMNDTLYLRFVLLRLITMTCPQWAVDCRASSLSYLSLNCSYSDFLIYAFSGRSEYTYFFRRKVSASRILQVPGALFLGFFQKLFAVCASQ